MLLAVRLQGFLAVLLMMACGPAAGPLQVRTDADSSDQPLSGLSSEQLENFADGDGLFDLSLREADGLGPVAIRQSCGACHTAAGRGPGFVERMAQVQGDGVTPVAGQPELPFGTVIRRFTVGGARPILAPERLDIRRSTRLGAPVMGLGYLEAVADEDLEALAAAQATRTDGISGRVNHVVWKSQPNADTRFHRHQPGDVVIGRFGLKARQATLDDFSADALQGDMGLTSPLRPVELANPDGRTDDAKPGLDLTEAQVNQLAMYVRFIAIPSRAAGHEAGAQAFTQAGCEVCHATLHTRAEWPIAALANVTAPVFTDLLLHDLGPSFADGLVDGEASSTEWRTAPLIGLRFLRSYLHDGRASSIEQAVLLHGGEGSEARASVQAFQALSAEQQQALLEYVSSL